MTQLPLTPNDSNQTMPKLKSAIRPFAIALVSLTCCLAGPVGPASAVDDPAAAAGPRYEITSDVVYGHKAGLAMTYDVIRRTEETNGAAVMFMLSGGWVSGWINPEAFVSEQVPVNFRHFRELVEQGYTLVVVRHGSSPLFKVPDAVSDVRKALVHLKSNASQFQIAGDRIGVCGASAGGHLSLMLGTAPVEGPTDATAEANSKVAAVVAYFPPVDLRQIVGPSDSFPALDFDPEVADKVSPILHVTADDAPTLLIHGDADRLVALSNSTRIFESLQEQGVASELIVIEGAGHGFGDEDAKRASSALIAWFDKYLLGRDNAKSIEEVLSDR